MSSFAGPNDLRSRTIANIVPGTILLPIGLLITGWTTQSRVFWLAPDVVSDLNCVLLVGVIRDIRRALRLSGPASLYHFKASRRI